MTSYLNLRISPEMAEVFSKKLRAIKEDVGRVQILHDSKHNSYEIRIGGFGVVFGEEMYNKLLTHPVVVADSETLRILLEKDHITIDELVRLSPRQLEYLVKDCGIKIINSQVKKGDKKVKHTMPYWANDWRNK